LIQLRRLCGDKLHDIQIGTSLNQCKVIGNRAQPPIPETFAADMEILIGTSVRWRI